MTDKTDSTDATTPTAPAAPPPPAAQPPSQPTTPASGATPPPPPKQAVDWHAKYADALAIGQIHFEAWYCAICGLVYALATLGIWCANHGWLCLWGLDLVDRGAYRDFTRYAFAWLGGGVGGALG